MTDKRIIAVDPGKTCGVFVLAPDENKWTTWEGEADDALAYARRQISAFSTAIVVERYTFTPKLTPQYDAVECIGVLRYFTRCHPNTKLVMQSRAQKSLVTNDVLREIGWYTPGEDHANDAARHCLIYLTATRPDHPTVRRALDMIAVEV